MELRKKGPPASYYLLSDGGGASCSMGDPDCPDWELTKLCATQLRLHKKPFTVHKWGTVGNISAVLSRICGTSRSCAIPSRDFDGSTFLILLAEVGVTASEAIAKRVYDAAVSLYQMPDKSYPALLARGGRAGSGTVAHVCARFDNHQLLRTLGREYVCEVDSRGRSALCYAAFFNSVESISTLIRFDPPGGDSVFARPDANGKSPLNHAFDGFDIRETMGLLDGSLQVEGLASLMVWTWHVDRLTFVACVQMVPPESRSAAAMVRSVAATTECLLVSCALSVSVHSTLLDIVTGASFGTYKPYFCGFTRGISGCIREGEFWCVRAALAAHDVRQLGWIGHCKEAGAE